MNAGKLGAIVRRILLVADQKSADQSDLHLLKCFVAEKDEAAFAALMERHGRLVFGVCRSVLQEQDAEDAFQATFLVLARMASSIRKGNSLASWLHGVALRTALKARQAMNTRRRKERQAGTRTPEQPASEAAFRELQALLHEEVGRLAEKYRAPFVLCCLEGKSRTEASQELGWKEGTVASRVAQARKLLESRLLRRGIALPAALTATTLAPLPASAAVPMVARGAVAFAGGNVPEAVSTKAVTLAKGVIRAMFVTKLKSVASVVLLLTLVLGSAGLLARSAWQSRQEHAALVALPPKLPAEKPVAPPNDGLEADVLPVGGDGLEPPLPQGAIIRFGTTRFRTGTVVGGVKLSRDGKTLITGGRASGGGVYVFDAANGRRIACCPLGEEAELSRDGARLFLIESLPPAARPRPPANVSPLMAEARNVLKIYQLSTGKLLLRIDGSGCIYRFAISPDERTLALEYSIPNVDADPADFAAKWFFKTRVELYDLKTGRLTHKLGELPKNHAGNGVVCFSADSKSLLAVSSSKENNLESGPESTVRRFDVATGVLKSKTTIPNSSFRVLPHFDGNRILAVTGNKVWDLEKERLHWASRGELAGIYGFMPDNRTLIGYSKKTRQLAGEDIASQVVHWDMVNDREIRYLPARTSFQAVSPDGKTCYGADWPYNRWFRWDFASGKEIDAVDAPTAPADRLALSADGKYLATPGGVWDCATGKCVHSLLSPDRAILFFTPDSKSLVYRTCHLNKPGPGGLGQAHGIAILNLATWQESNRELEDFEHGMNVYYCGMTLSPDGKVLAGPYQLWDFASGKLIGKLAHDDVQARASMFAFSPDSKKLAYFAPANRVQVWSIADRKVVSDWPIGEHRDRNLAFVQGGELVASSYLPPRPPWRGMKFPKNELRKPIKEKLNPKDLPDKMPPMPDAVVRVWDPATGKEKYRFQYPQSEYDGTEMPPLFSPNGKLLATASYHEEAVVFRDAANGKEVGRFRCGVKGVHSMAFSRDGQVLAVAAKDTTVLLVDVRKLTAAD